MPHVFKKTVYIFFLSITRRTVHGTLEKGFVHREFQFSNVRVIGNQQYSEVVLVALKYAKAK